MIMKLCKYCSRIIVLFGAMSIIAPLVIPINVWSLLPWSESVVFFMAALFPIIHALSSVSPMPEVVSTTISMSLIYAVILGHASESFSAIKL
jgi:VIT1/CCC1 family predicted Fe2+/Mn2+ transporter